MKPRGSQVRKLSLYPLTMEQALHAALNTPLPKRKPKKKSPAKKAGRPIK